MGKAEKFTDLEVYGESIKLSSEIFRISRTFPREEAYSLTDQIRRSSRSIGANIAEAWAKRRFPAHFVSKLSDADAELQETIHWIGESTRCRYIDANMEGKLLETAGLIGRMLGKMMKMASSFRPVEEETS